MLAGASLTPSPPPRSLRLSEMECLATPTRKASLAKEVQDGFNVDNIDTEACRRFADSRAQFLRHRVRTLVEQVGVTAAACQGLRALPRPATSLAAAGAAGSAGDASVSATHSPITRGDATAGAQLLKLVQGGGGCGKTVRDHESLWLGERCQQRSSSNRDEVVERCVDLAKGMGKGANRNRIRAMASAARAQAEGAGDGRNARVVATAIDEQEIAAVISGSEADEPCTGDVATGGRRRRRRGGKCGNARRE